MPFCSKCGSQLGASDQFCRNCGATTAAPEFVPAQTPVIVEPAPQVCGEVVCSTKSKVLGFVGMGLAIGGLFMAVVGIIYTLIYLGVGAAADMGAMAFAMALVFGMFSFPLSIIGGVLCDRSSENGNTSAACSIGSKMRVAGIIVSAVMMFFGFIGLLF